MNRLIIIGNSRSYHAIDWYRTVKRLVGERVAVSFATDLIDSEGHTVLITGEDHVISLLNIDNLLLKKQSSFGNIWRNVVKMLVFPFQVLKLRTAMRENSGAVLHAHSMYYLFVCWLAGVRFIGTPLGSEVLVRSQRSRFYRFFAAHSLRAAHVVTVDSEAMKAKIFEFSGVKAVVVQNGVDIQELRAYSTPQAERTKVTSVRGIAPLYRIHEILASRNSIRSDIPMTFLYPFWDESYKARIAPLFGAGDVDLGRLNKSDMYRLLGESLLVISVPESDSSPRSVYEAIFAGAFVAATYARWIEGLPPCMRERVIIVDLTQEGWFDAVLREVGHRSVNEYVPSLDAVEAFDQQTSMSRVVREVYGLH